jgi:predicted transcriptional regulator
MKLITHLHDLQRLHELIRRKATGAPDQLAARLDCSRASVYRLIEALEDFGAQVTYCKERRSFVYEEDFELDSNRV